MKRYTEFKTIVDKGNRFRTNLNLIENILSLYQTVILKEQTLFPHAKQ